MRDKESRLASLMEEYESQQTRVRALKEELAEKDGQLRVANMNLETADKQREHHMQEVAAGTCQRTCCYQFRLMLVYLNIFYADKRFYR